MKKSDNQKIPTGQQGFSDGRWRRLALALEKLGITAKLASIKAGRNPGYVHDYLHEKSESKDQFLKAICDVLGIRWEWFDGQVPESAPMFKSQLSGLPSQEREMLLLFLEGVVSYLAPGRPEPDVRAFASILCSMLLDIVESPQISGVKSEHDKVSRERIRTLIHGALRSLGR